MNMLELKDGVAALKADFDARDREWRKLCRKHGGARAALALAWGRDDELARSIRAVMIPRNAALATLRKAQAGKGAVHA